MKKISKYSEWLKEDFLLLSMWQLLPKWYDLGVHPMFHLVLTTISSNEDVFSRHPRWGCLDCTSEFCFVCLYLVWIDHIVHVRVFHSLCVVVQSYTNLKREFFYIKVLSFKYPVNVQFWNALFPPNCSISKMC